MPRFQRARSPDEIAIRTAAIMRAARALALASGPIELKLNDVSRRTKLSKPTLYRYFESREHILVGLCLEELEGFVAELELVLVQPQLGIATVTDAIVRGYLTRPLMCQLLGMLASILEHNLSFDSLVATKRALCVLTFRASAVLSRLSWLSAPDALWVTQTISLYLSSLWPAAHPSSLADEVFGLPEFRGMKPNADAELRRFVEVLLNGLQRSST